MPAYIAPRDLSADIPRFPGLFEARRLAAVYFVHDSRPDSINVSPLIGELEMRGQKGSRRIVVGDAEYRWRAAGNDGYILIGIWPTNNTGPSIQGSLRYHETWIDNGDGSRSSAGDQIVITNRIIRRIIEHAIAVHGYDPQVRGKELNLRVLDDVVKWDDAVRGVSDAIR